MRSIGWTTRTCEISTRKLWTIYFSCCSSFCLPERQLMLQEFVEEEKLHESFHMLDPGVIDASGLRHICEASVTSQVCIQAGGQRSTTVKELLMLKRQRWKCSEEDNSMEHTFKSAKQDTFPSDASLCTLVDPDTATLFPPPDPDNSVNLSLPLWVNEAPMAGVKLSLFSWQIQQAAQKVGDICPELLTWQDADGDTYLHIAVAQGRRALAYVLAEKMAKCGSLDVKEHNGQTALHVAAATNQHLIIRDLLAHGAQINTFDLWGRSPLHVCSEKGHSLCLQTFSNGFFKSGQMMDVDIFNYEGLTPLHTAVLFHNNVIKELRPLGSPCSHLAEELMQRKRMFVQCIQTLLLMGASLKTKDLKSGRTSLHMASEVANVELLQLFLNQPHALSAVNVKTCSGNTALHIVSASQNHQSKVEAVKLLMRKGADPRARNHENEVPSQLLPVGPIGEKVRQVLKGKRVYA